MASPVIPSEVEACIPSPSADLCAAFTKALLRLPVLLSKFFAWMLGEDGEFTDDFKVQVSAFAFPPGFIAPAGNSAAPDGWLLCNGQAVSRETYADLFTAIGTTYGVGDGSATFNVPDSRGKFLVGAGSFESGATVAVAGTGGAEKVTLAEANIPKIQVGLLASSGIWNATAGTGDSTSGIAVGADGAQTRNKILTEPFGEDTPTALSNLPPYLGVNYFIKC